MNKFKYFLNKHKGALLVVLLASTLRFYKLSDFPPSLNWDEISHGFNAYSILKTGLDEWGVSFPTIFKAYGDYKLPVYIYLTAIQEFIFGLNDFSVRMTSVLAGIGIVIFSYLLAKKLWGQKVGLVSALLVAIEPWSFFLSRGAFEANVGQFFIVSGIYLFVKGLEKHSLLGISSLFLGLSLWTYNSDRVFVPLLVGALLLLYKNTLNIIWRNSKNNLILPAFIFAIFFVPTIYQLGFEQAGTARYENVAIIDQGAINQIENARSTSKMSPLLSRFAYNKITYFAVRFGQNYLSHFSLNFLFINGGDNYQFNVQGKGLLYPVDLVLILLGLYYLFKNRREKFSQLLFIWLFLAPITASLTRESPHALRSITMLPVPMILSALGIYVASGWLNKNKATKTTSLILLVLVYAMFGLSYYKAYFNDYTKNYSQAWQYGYKETVNYIKNNYNNYDQIIITKKYGEPHEFLLFYWSWNPDKYRNDPKLVRYTQSGWYWVDGFDKFIFVNDWDIPKNENKGWKTEQDKPIDVTSKTLLITSPNMYPQGWKKLETINFLDNKPAFDILENDVANNQ